MLIVRVPLTSAALAGKIAFTSLELIATVSFVATKFQFASTALTVRLNATPAVWLEGVAVLPLGVPGAAASPGASNCNLATAPALIVMAGLVLEVLVLSVRSLAVKVA